MQLKNTLLTKFSPFIFFSFIYLDHIVPAENVLAIALPSGPQNIEFEFTAVNRSNTAMVSSIDIDE